MKSAVFDCSGEAFFVGAQRDASTGTAGKMGNRMPDVVAAGTGATPAAFYLGLCRLRGILSPPASATVILQAGNLSCYSDGAAGGPFLAAAAMALHRFVSLALKLRIDARWRA